MFWILSRKVKFFERLLTLLFIRSILRRLANPHKTRIVLKVCRKEGTLKIYNLVDIVKLPYFPKSDKFIMCILLQKFASSFRFFLNSFFIIIIWWYWPIQLKFNEKFRKLIEYKIVWLTPVRKPNFIHIIFMWLLFTRIKSTVSNIGWYIPSMKTKKLT